MPTTSKRKATDASNNRAAKKTRLVAAIVDDILADTDNYPVDDEDAVRKTLVDLAEYCRDLEQQIADSQPKELSPEELEAATEKVRITVHSGIRKQMTVCPHSKHVLYSPTFVVETNLQNKISEMVIRRSLLRSFGLWSSTWSRSCTHFQDEEDSQ